MNDILASPVSLVIANKTAIIQLVLILGIVAITGWLFIKRGAKQLAVRRLLIIFFAGFAMVAVLFPSLTTVIAHAVGVGRGTDLLLYMTVLMLLAFIALQEARTKGAEKRTTHLARHIAIDRAANAESYRASSFEAHHQAAVDAHAQASATAHSRQA